MSDEHAEPPGTDQVSDYEDRSISCIDCGEDFIWTVGEQEFFHNLLLIEKIKLFDF